MKDIFKESELTIYPLGIHAGKITVFLYHPDRLEAFFPKKACRHCCMRLAILTQT